MRSAIVGLFLLVALPGCFPEVPAPASAPVPPSAPDSAADGWVGGVESETRAAGIPYVERTTGGARPDEQLPMIVALHGRGGSTHKLEAMFARFPARARLIIPRGTPFRGGYSWYHARSKRDRPEVFAAAVRPVADQLAAAVAELRARRPTVGRAVVCGFSQGGVLAFALAVLHPEQVAAAFPIAGHLPFGFSAARFEGPPPYVHAFHGIHDVTYERARSSVEEIRRQGGRAELTGYPLGHELGQAEAQQVLSHIASAVSRHDAL
jgi:phospholipase/carboxylesterase